MHRTYFQLIQNFKKITRKKHNLHIIQYNFVYINFLVKKLVNICTKKGLQQKTENIFIESFLALKQTTKKDISLLVERSFSFLNMLFGNTLEYFGTKKIIKGILINNYQQYLQSINQFITYMKTSQKKTLALKIYNALLELSSEKGYLFSEKKKKYISVLKTAK